MDVEIHNKVYMVEWCVYLNFFICCHRGYCILSVSQGWTEISPLKHKWANLNAGIKKECFRLDYHVFFHVIYNFGKVWLHFFSTFSSVLFEIVFTVCVSVCIWFWSADGFSESTYYAFKSPRRLPRRSPQQLLNVHKLLFA